MQKFSLLFIALLFYHHSYSQDYLGLRIDDVTAAVSQTPDNRDLALGKADGFNTLVWANPKIRAMYLVLFDTNNIATKQWLTLDGDDYMVSTIKYFDGKYTKVSYGHWIFIKNEKVIYVDLGKKDTGRPWFIFHY